MKNLNVLGATMQICLASGVKAIAVRNIGGVVTDEQRGAKMINRILEMLEEKKKEYLEAFRTHGDNERYGIACGFGDSIKIVQEVAKEYGNGWIPCSERLPKEGVPVLVCNASGKVYIRQINWISRGRTEIPNWSQNSTGIIAWQPLPEPFNKGE